MDSKRSTVSTNVRKGQPKPSKTKVGRAPSDVSMTPSQVAEKERLAGRKDPLDALSRTMPSRFPTSEKRSGLQDVDEEYLKHNLFTKRNTPKHAGLDDGFEFKAPKPKDQAAQNTANVAQSEASFRAQGGAEEAPAATASQAQFTQQQEVQQQQQSQAQNAQPTPSQAQMQYQANAQQANAQQQQANMMQGKNVPKESQQTAGAGEPDLCTTCPNCKTTFYLVGAPVPISPDDASTAALNQGARETNQ